MVVSRSNLDLSFVVIIGDTFAVMAVDVDSYDAPSSGRINENKAISVSSVNAVARAVLNLANKKI